MTDVVEVPASRLAILERVEKLANGLFSDPKLGMTVKKAFKEKYPDAVLPEVDAAIAAEKAKAELSGSFEEKFKGLTDTVKSLADSVAAREKASKEEREQANFESQAREAMRKYSLTEEGLQAAFERMKATNSPDVEAAAAWVASQVKAQPVSNNTFSNYNPSLFGAKQEDEKWALLNKNPFDYKFAEQEIAEINNNFANGRGHIYGMDGMGGEL